MTNVAHLTQVGYAPKPVDHVHDVLSAILRTAVKWASPRESRCGDGLADTQMRASEVDIDHRSGSLTALGSDAAGTDDGRVGHPLWSTPRGALRAPLEGHLCRSEMGTAGAAERNRGAVKDGVVTLTGTVDSYTKKYAAEEAAHRVGV
jgi:hypothetical protein